MIRFVPRDERPFPKQAAAALRPYGGVTARLLYARGVTDAAQADAFMHPTLDQFHDPLLMPGMEKALRLLAEAKRGNWPVVVYGDYDVDGMCATALLSLALGRYGLNVSTYTPLRAQGYGLNGDAVRSLAETYKLLITVDLGITNHEEVRLAQSLGMTVIVTDHHGLDLEESPADAVMNPLLGGYPFPRLCGAGVAFKLAQALLGLEACREYLDLAALATVADIVPLTGENRVLVSLGLKAIAARKRPGLSALLNVSGSPEAVTADTLGFQLGPRLNAAGRLDDAAKGVRLLTTASGTQAEELARDLDILNTRRKSDEAALVKEAEAAALNHDFLREPALIVAGDNWHAGVIGLAAGRLCQRYSCPACVLSRQDGLLHGSLRSVPGVHIHHCLQACDDLLLRYGGHELAAGVTLSAENEAAFRERLQGEIRKANPACFQPSQPYDGELSLADCTPALYRELSLLAPFGCGNPAPLLLARNARLEERRAVGTAGAHLKLTLRQEEKVMGGIAFSMGGLASALPDKVDVIFALEENTFRGVTSLQAHVTALRAGEDAQALAFAAPDGEKEQNGLLNALLSLLRMRAGKTGSDTEILLNGDDFAPAESDAGESGGVPADSSASADAFALSPQPFSAFVQAVTSLDRGVLAVAHTRAAAARALKACPLDVVSGAPVDPRSFHTLLACPAPELVSGHWAQVWLLDGELFPGERALWADRLPGAAVHALDVSDGLRALAAAVEPGDEGCRALFRALRRNAFPTLGDAAQAAGLTSVQARAALNAFRELGLLTLTESPFAYALPPPVPCSLSDSPLLAALGALGSEEQRRR